jgi:hypothetical protein
MEIKSGNKNKSIGGYIDKIINYIIINKKIIIKAYENNMNKLITIVEIIKNKEKNGQFNYNIGKENNKVFIQCEIIIENDNNIKELLGNRKNKRNNIINNLNNNNNNNKNIEDNIINNINNLF